MIQLLQQDPLAFVILAAVLLFSLAAHEWGHAWVADRMGDPTARNLGRVTLNPFNHLDPLGSLLILIVGFGWAKPVLTKPMNFRDYRMGVFWVSIAGILVNLAIAIAALILLGSLGVKLSPNGLIATNDFMASSMGQTLARVLLTAARINIILACFNLIPVPPLDGSKTVQAFAPKEVQVFLWQLERYGFLLVILLITVFDRQVNSFIYAVMSFFMKLFL
ncbi:MAG: site-2 protease family protein [Deinococcales bacterium]